MKNVNVTLEDLEHDRLIKKKGKDVSWRDYLLSTLKTVDKREWKAKVIARAKEEEAGQDRLLDIAFEELNRVE